MVLTFKNYNRGNANIGDVLEVWKNGQPPQEVMNFFNDNITDISIRSLHQADFKMFKDSLVVDTVIEVDKFMVILTKNDNAWQIVLYKRENNRKHRAGISHQETMFVKKDKDVHSALRTLLVEYSLK